MSNRSFTTFWMRKRTTIPTIMPLRPHRWWLWQPLGVYKAAHTPPTPHNNLAKVTTAINQLSANQTAIMQQMAAMSFSPPPFIAVPAFNVPPIQNVMIPKQQLFTGVWCNPGTGYAHGSGRCRGNGCGGCGGHGGQGRNPFANHMANLGCGLGQQMPKIGGFPRAAIPESLPPPQLGMQCGRASHSNIYKGGYGKRHA